MEELKGTVLVMLSGGVDSVYLLYHYLKNYDNYVHAHHISYRHPATTRGLQEDIACHNVINWLNKNVRSVGYSQSRYECNYQIFMGWDSDLCLLEASRCAANIPGSTELVTVDLGWCKEDMANPRNTERQDRGTNRNLWSAICNSVGDRDSMSFKAALAPEIRRELIKIGITKREMEETMPPELLAMCWSCRWPEGDKPCGKCNACMARIL